jgi:hypothetical protein
MSFNGSGTFLINTAGQPVVAGTVISSTAFNALTADLATGLSTVITKDGQTTVTANIPMSTYKFTGLGVGSAATDSANLSQVQSTVTKLLTSVSGTDTITAVGAPVVAAYAAGQMFYFVATGDNTGAVTLNIDSLGAKAVTRDGSVALAAGDIKSGEVVVVVYDGTRFQVVSQLNSAGNATFANVSITSALNVGGVATFSAGTAAAPAITTTGDTNTGIFFPAADTIGFTEGGVEAARFDSSGNLGIGTSSPASKLHVANTAAATRITITDDVAAGRSGYIESNFSDALVIGTTSGVRGIRFSPDNTPRMFLDTAGNLGIGTNSPAYKLDVTGTSTTALSAAGFTNNSSANNTTKTVGITFRLADTVGVIKDSAYITAFPDGANVLSAGVAFSTRTGDANPTEKMRLDSSGNLGIGTSSPNSKLEVTIGDNDGITVEQSGANQTGYLNFRDSDGNYQGRISYDHSNDALRFATSNTERARITSGGKFLLNTTSTVVSGDEICGMIGTSGIGVKCTGGSANFAASFWNDATSGDNVFVNFYTETGGTLRGTITYNRAGGLVAYNTTSDYRSKDIFGPVQNSGATIDALKVYEGQMKGASQSRPMLVAHEAQEHAPYAVTGEKDAVNEDGTPKYQQMDVSALVPLLLAEIQSLRARVAQLESK